MAKAAKHGTYSDLPLPGNPRHTEAWALMQCARRMREAQDAGSRDDMLAALRLNWHLWTIFQAEILSPECPLPQDMRGNVISLSNFIDKETIAFIASPNADLKDVDALIRINRELASGLYSTPQEGKGGTSASSEAVSASGPDAADDPATGKNIVT